MTADGNNPDAECSRRFALVTCEIFHREMCLAVSRTVNQIDMSFLPKGLHDLPASEMLSRVQDAVDAVDSSLYEAVLMGYGLCNNGLHGLQARDLPLILPRAHDCITLFLGSKERYRDYFFANPGVYFKTTGWVERNHVEDGELRQLSIPAQMGMTNTLEELIEQYGEDNGRFLYNELYDQTRNYSRYTYISMGLPQDERYKQDTRREAENQGWSYEEVEGDMTMIQRLADGNWPEDVFLTVPPGHKVHSTAEDNIVSAVPAE